MVPDELTTEPAPYRPSWSWSAAQWQERAEQLRAEVSQIPMTERGVPEEHRALWQAYARHTDNPPAQAMEAKGDGGVEAEDAEVARLLSEFPAEDLRFVRRVRIESYPGEIAAQIRALGGRVFGELHGQALGDEILLAASFRSMPERARSGSQGKLELLAHEVGHTLYRNLPEVLREEWTRKIHRGETQIEVLQNARDLGEMPPTVQASESAAEDFCESYRIHRFGGVDPYVRQAVGGKVPGEVVGLGEHRGHFLNKVDLWLGSKEARAEAALSRAERPIWKKSFSEFARGFPDDLERQIHEVTEDSYQKSVRWLAEVGSSVAADRNVTESAVRARTKASMEQTERAWSVICEVQAHLQAALPGAKVQIAGSFARGDFTQKGVRSFDLDLHISGIDASSESEVTGTVSEEVKKAFKKGSALAKKAGMTLDLFVTHEGKLWGVTPQYKLSRKPGRFGKTERRTSNGLTIRGLEMTWDEFQQSFYYDLATYEREVRAAIARGEEVPPHVREAVDTKEKPTHTKRLHT